MSNDYPLSKFEALRAMINQPGLIVEDRYGVQLRSQADRFEVRRSEENWTVCVWIHMKDDRTYRIIEPEKLEPVELDAEVTKTIIEDFPPGTCGTLHVKLDRILALAIAQAIRDAKK